MLISVVLVEPNTAAAGGTMEQHYTLLGFISLNAGSWADWFSGTMSALAVATGLAAYPLARLQRRAEQRQRDADLGRAVGCKLLGVLNHTGDIDRHIKECLAWRAPEFPPGMKFPLVQPFGVPKSALPELNQTFGSTWNVISGLPK